MRKSMYIRPIMEMLSVESDGVLAFSIGGSTEGTGTRMGDGGNLEQFQYDEEIGW